MITIIAFILVFGILVLVHEMGHYLSARYFGVKIEEVAFGFPPRIWSKKKKGTIYSINITPLGGFVKMYGEDGKGKKDKKSLMSKKPWQKLIIFISGVIMNFLLAWILLTLFYAIGGQAIIPGMWEHKGIENNQKVYIIRVDESTPAEKEGIKIGDQIKKVEGAEVYTDMAAVEEIQKKAKKDKEEPVSITIVRGSSEIERQLLTYKDIVGEEENKIEIQRIGVALETRGMISAPFIKAPIVAAEETYRITKLTIFVVIDFIKKIFTQFRISESVVGPAGIVHITGAMAKVGFGALIQLVIILSVSLAVINIVPFPALDGGHTLILGIEKATKKEISQETKNTIQIIGFGLLLLLIVAITIKDFDRFNLLKQIKGIFK